MMIDAGWYPEPGTPTLERYWDGAQWTPDTRSVEQQSPPPSRGWLKWAIPLAVLVVAAAITIPLLLTRSSGGDSLTGYGQRPTDVAAHLKTCRSVTSFGKSVARCVDLDGDPLGIQTTDSEGEQGFAVALLKDRSHGECMVAIKGVIITAPTELALTEVVGTPEQFAADHNGFLLCPIP